MNIQPLLTDFRSTTFATSRRVHQAAIRQRRLDRAGRTRYTDQYKAEVVEAFAASGLSGPAFARQCGVKYPTFASWVTKARRQDGPRQEKREAPGAFGIIKEALGFRRFLMRGLEKVDLEWTLVTTSDSLKRLFNPGMRIEGA